MIISKVVAWTVAPGEWQVLRTMVARSCIKVAKLCADDPSANVLRAALARADAERSAGATGSRVSVLSASIDQGFPRKAVLDRRDTDGDFRVALVSRQPELARQRDAGA